MNDSAEDTDKEISNLMLRLYMCAWDLPEEAAHENLGQDKRLLCAYHRIAKEVVALAKEARLTALKEALSVCQKYAVWIDKPPSQAFAYEQHLKALISQTESTK